MDFPIESIHKKAFKAHEAANCAGDQDKYWEMHEKIFSTRKAAQEDLKQHAQSIGLDMNKFQECLDSGRYAADIRKDIAEGRKVGISGTPSFLFGLTGPDGTKLNATLKIRGAQPYSVFKENLDKLVSSKK
jgi:protein-disulfide isomerase